VKPSNYTDESGRLWGYARVSTEDQRLDLQIDDLVKAGVPRGDIYVEKISGAKRDRPELAKVTKAMRSGDTLVVWRLDRLGRSLLDLLTRLEALHKRGIKFRSLKDAIDTDTAVGRLFLHVLGAMAEFERQLTIERTKAGIRSHRAKGGRHGAPLKLDLAKTEKLLRTGIPVTEVARRMGVHVNNVYYHFDATVCRRLAAEGPKRKR